MRMPCTIALMCGIISAAPALSADPHFVIAPAVSEPSQEIVCRKEKEIGSLVKSKKTCHSRAQWAYIDDTNRQFSRQLADDTRTKPSS